MSALASLSLIAPAAPTALQGTAGEDASLFQSLLDEAGKTDAAAGSVKPSLVETQPNDEGDAALAAAATGQSALTPPHVAVTPVVDGSEASTSSAVTDVASKTEGAFSDVLTQQGAAPTVAGAVPAQTANTPVTTGAATAAPSPAADDAVTRAVMQQAAAEQVSAEQSASSADILKTAQAAALQPGSAPAPLKPLTERASKPLDAVARAVASGGEAAASYAPADASRVNTAPGASGPPIDGGGSAVASADTPVEAAAAVASPDLSEDAEAGARPAPLESTSAATHASGPREAALSSLSRTTIDATAQIAAQILRKLEGRSTRFEMSLTPDDLGRVDVKLDIDAEGRLAARLAFDNPAAAADLRGRADELRRQLQDAGFHLADDAFEFADRDSGSSAFDRGQGGDGRQNRAFSAASRLNAETDIVQPPRWMALSLTPAGVDLKV